MSWGKAKVPCPHCGKEISELGMLTHKPSCLLKKIKQQQNPTWFLKGVRRSSSALPDTSLVAAKLRPPRQADHRDIPFSQRSANEASFLEEYKCEDCGQTKHDEFQFLQHRRMCRSLAERQLEERERQRKTCEWPRVPDYCPTCLRSITAPFDTQTSHSLCVASQPTG